MAQALYSRVLIVDDDEMTRITLREVLNHDGFYTLCAENGRIATHIVRKENLDLVFLDYEMPGLDGIEVLREIKHIKSFLPVIMITGAGTDELLPWALAAGAFSLLTKPVELNLMRETIHNALFKYRFEI